MVQSTGVLRDLLSSNFDRQNLMGLTWDYPPRKEDYTHLFKGIEHEEVLIKARAGGCFLILSVFGACGQKCHIAGSYWVLGSRLRAWSVG